MNLVRRLLFSTMLLNQYRYDASPQNSPSDFYKEFKFRELTPEDFSNNAVFEIKNRKKRYLNHLKDGHRCFGFEKEGGDIVSYFWLSMGDKAGSQGVPLFYRSAWLLKMGEAYIWDCRTVEGWRRQGLYKEGINRLLSFCGQQGATKIMMSCDALNQASHAGILSAGFTYYGKLRCIRVGRLKLVWCQKKMPKLSLLSSPVTTSDVFP